eukprot:4940481-Lingulodinium_polyedra.AAC.1
MVVRSMFGEGWTWEQAFACEKAEMKQAFLQKWHSIPIIFNDTANLSDLTAYDCQSKTHCLASPACHWLIGWHCVALCIESRAVLHTASCPAALQWKRDLQCTTVAEPL